MKRKNSLVALELTFSSLSLIYKHCKKRQFISILLVATTFICGRSSAQVGPDIVSPLLTGHYMPGFIDIRDYADPAPVTGLIIVDYNAYLSGNKFYGADGKQITQISGPLGSPVNLNVNASGYSNTPLLLWVPKEKIFGATYFNGITLPYLTVNSNLAYSRIGIIDSVHHSGDVNGNVSGVSDLGVMPFFLSWGLTNFDLTAGWMVYMPTGKYTSGGNNNTGLGFWSNLFQAFGFWYPEKINGQPSKALAIMLGATFELTSKIIDADVKPGNRFSLDYGIEQYMSDNLSVGIYGGNNWQISQDKGSQVYWNPSVLDKLGVLGFQLGYWLWPNRLQAIGKYGWNYAAVQRFEQSTFMLNLIFVTNALTGNKPAKTK